MIRGLQTGASFLKGLDFAILSEDELYEIHLATLDVLQNYGVKVFGDEAHEIFAGSGAAVDSKRNHVKIPPHLVEEAIRTAPASVLLAGRKEAYDLYLQDRRVGFTNFGIGTQVVDPYSNLPRDATKQDISNTAKVCDALEHIDIYVSALTTTESMEKAVALIEAEASMPFTEKHFMHGGFAGEKETNYFFEMAAAVAGGMEKLQQRPLVSVIVCPNSPLELHDHVSETIIACAKAGIPCNVLSMAMAGASAPVSLAGTLVTHNAEVLSGIVLSQLTAPGAPVIYGSSTTTFDLNVATAAVGAPELGMISAGVAALAKDYQLPSFVAGG